jgi:pyridoxal phosphate enzyme (YggS family)
METSSDAIRRNLALVRARIASAALRSGRAAQAITLVAVTKKMPLAIVRLLADAGAEDLGENYPQELWTKAAALGDRPAAPRWHLIGHLQGNKAKRTLPLVTMIHAVDSLKLLQTLDSLASDLPTAPAVCLQVNTSAEEAKHGWPPEGILSDAKAIAACRKIPIVGLMTMAAWGTDAETARPSFRRLRQVRDELRQRTGLSLAELSMGMSADFESAIEEGATLLRIGSALFEGVTP